MHGLEQQFGSQMQFVIADYQKGDSPERIKRYELGQHGMVITDAAGNKLWGEPGHNQTLAGVTAAVQKVLKP